MKTIERISSWLQEVVPWTLPRLPLVPEADDTITFRAGGRIWKRKRGTVSTERCPRGLSAIGQGQPAGVAGQFQQRPAARRREYHPHETFCSSAAEIRDRRYDPGITGKASSEDYFRRLAFKDWTRFCGCACRGVVGSRRYLLACDECAPRF